MKCRKRIPLTFLLVATLFAYAFAGAETHTPGDAIPSRAAMLVDTPVERIEIEVPSEPIALFTYGQLIAKVYPENATNPSVSWDLSDGGIADIDRDGKILAMAPGVVTVTATAKDGSGVNGSAQVVLGRPVTDITFNYSSVKMNVGETMYDLKATVFPEDASIRALEYWADPPGVAQITGDGILTGISPGTATLYARALDASGVYASCPVTVIKPVERIELTTPLTKLSVHEQAVFQAEVYPADASDKGILWESNKDSVAIVDETGNVKALSPGTATITATARDGSGVKASTEITVVQPVTAIRLSTSSATLFVGGQLTLLAEALPENAGDKGILWESDNKTVATVDGNGNIKALSCGAAVITATARDGYGSKASAVITAVQPVTSIQFSASSATLFVGGKFTLNATVLPANAANRAIAWSSSDNSIATVDANGSVKALKPGTVTLTATARDGSGSKATAMIKIVQPVTSIGLSASPTTILAGGKFTLLATVLPANAANRAIAWSSSDSSVASVDENGNVKALKTGTAVLTAMAKDGGGAKATRSITVLQPVTSIGLSESPATLNVGGGHTLLATVLPANAANKGLSWSSSDSSIASVDERGNVRALKTGTAVLTATAKDGGGAKATRRITVVQPVRSIQLTAPALNVRVGGVIKLTASALPQNATNPNITWKSGDASVASVDEIGNVQGLKPGKTTITATAKDGSGVKAVKEISVVQPVTGITLNIPDLTVAVGQVLRTVRTDVLPANASNKALVFSSDKPSVAAVEKDGAIRGVSKGTTTVRISAADGSGKTASLTVRVVDKKKGVTSITLNKKSASILKGKSVTLRARLKPSGAKNKAVTWTSSDPSVATVSKKGVVKGQKPGKAVITATASSGYTAMCSVTVKEVPVSRLRMKKSSVTVKVGGTYRQVPTISPSNAGNKVLTWSSGNKKVATVDQNGQVKAIGKGKAKITAKSANGKTASYTVKVK